MNEEQIMNWLSTVYDEVMKGVEYVKQVEKKVDDFIKSTDQRFSENDEKLNDLRSTVYEEIIDPANAYIDEMDRNERFNSFNEKYGEKLRPFNDTLSVLEGDDFDVVRSAFDQYDNFDGEKVGEEDYVEALVDELGNTIQKIKQGLGVPEDTEITVEQTEDGETVVATEDGEVIASEGGDEEPETPAEESEDEDEGESEEEPGDDPEEIAAFEEELKNIK